MNFIVLPSLTDRLRISSNTNRSAGAFNAAAWEENMALTPLVNPVTGDAIPDFPRTYGDVQRLNARELGGLLRAFNLHDARNAEQKRGDFFRAIGVTQVTRR